jgi:hypothetical protein
MESGIIYIATNLINGKQYVGQTKTLLRKRINEHIRRKNRTHFEYALNKYGLNNFYIFIIKYPKEELNEWETYYIKMFNTFNTSNGYNHTTGGGVWEVSDATKKKDSIAKSGKNNYWFGKHHSEETLEKMSIAQSGENNTMFGRKGNECPSFGKHQSENHKNKLSISKGNNDYKKKMSGENNPKAKLNNKKIEEIKLLLWENILNHDEIGKIFGVTQSTIWCIAHNKSWIFNLSD